MSDPVTLTNLEDLKVVDIRAALSERKLPTVGNRDVLLPRLKEALEKENAAAAAPTEQVIEQVTEQVTSVPTEQVTEQVAPTPTEQVVEVSPPVTPVPAPVPAVPRTWTVKHNR